MSTKRAAEVEAHQAPSKKANVSLTSEPSKIPMEISKSDFSTNPDFLRLLLKLRAQDLRPPGNKIFIAQRTDKVVDVWRGMIQHKFLSVPVLQQTGTKWYGFVDMADIVLFIVENFGHSALLSENDYFKLLEKEELFRQKTINDIMKYPFTRRNPFNPVSRNYSLFFAIELLAREEGLHRLPVVDENRHLMNLITQSQVISFLRKNLDMLGNKRLKPLAASPNLFFKPVVTIGHLSTAYEAFRTMVLHKVSGLAVVDGDGKLKGNISLRDLKAITPDAKLFFRLSEKVMDFLANEKLDYPKDSPEGPIAVKANETIENVIKILSDRGIHRVYIVDDNHKPIGVASLTDILREIISFE